MELNESVKLADIIADYPFNKTGMAENAIIRLPSSAFVNFLIESALYSASLLVCSPVLSN